jgi:hypothetical protein
LHEPKLDGFRFELVQAEESFASTLAAQARGESLAVEVPITLWWWV